MQNNYFKSSDLNLCSFIISSGYCISSTEKNKDNTTVFYIIRDDNLDRLIELYFSHQAKVDPILFAYNQKLLKTRIYHS